MSQQPPDGYDYEGYTPPYPPPDMDPEEMYDDEMEERGFQPGFRPPSPGIRPPIGVLPPGPRPPHGQPHPRPPFGPPLGWFPERWGKYQWPFWGMWGYRLRNAWRDIKHLTDIVQDIIVSMISSGIIAPGPNSPVPGPGGGTTGTGGVIVSPTAPANPAIGQLWFDSSTDQVKFWDGTAWEPLTVMQGVTDGSNAKPGQIGEVLYAEQTGSVSMADMASTTAVVSTIILSPGDWDVTYSVEFGSGLMGATCALTPVPTGLQNDMLVASLGYTAPGTPLGEFQFLSLVSPSTRASVSAPTLLPFTLTLYSADLSASAGGAATYTFRTRARRMR